MLSNFTKTSLVVDQLTLMEETERMLRECYENPDKLGGRYESESHHCLPVCHSFSA